MRYIKRVLFCLAFSPAFILAQNSQIILEEGIKFYVNDKDYRKAANSFQKAASLNNVYAQLFGGWCYEQGVGVSKNEKLAFLWYNKAASNKNPEACYKLAMAYLNGNGINQSDKKAIHWYKKAEKYKEKYEDFDEYSLEELFDNMNLFLHRIILNIL